MITVALQKVGVGMGVTAHDIYKRMHYRCNFVGFEGRCRGFERGLVLTKRLWGGG